MGIKLELLYNTVSVSAVQQSEPAIFIHISCLYWIAFPSDGQMTFYNLSLKFKDCHASSIAQRLVALLNNFKGAVVEDKIWSGSRSQCSTQNIEQSSLCYAVFSLVIYFILSNVYIYQYHSPSSPHLFSPWYPCIKHRYLSIAFPIF